MPGRTIRFTSDFQRHFASARICCGKCGHKLTANPEDLARMFPVAMKLDVARFRLRCRACGGRMPEIQILPKPPRD